MSTLRTLVLLAPVAGSVALQFACKGPPEAPEELDELSRFLYREWDDRGAAVNGLKQLEAFVDANVSPDAGLSGRVWRMSPLLPADVPHERPDRPLANVLGTGQVFFSDYSVEAHAELQTRADQLPVEPTAVAYVRDFPDEPAPTCFADASCDDLYTENDITRETGGLLEVQFELLKHFKHFSYELDDGTPREAFYSRSWLAREWEGDGGTLLQSYTADLWIGTSDSTTLRMQVLWSETAFDSLEASDEAQATLINASVNNAFKATEDVLGAEGDQ